MDLNETRDLSPLDQGPQALVGAVQTEIDAESEAKPGNGHLNEHAFGMHQLLHALQAMRIGELDRLIRKNR